MIQKFIPLGNGYTDFYELLTLGEEMSNRIQHFIAFKTTIHGEDRYSLGIVMKPTNVGDFQPIYICVEGISSTEDKESKRVQLFKDLAHKLDKEVVELVVQPSSHFGEQDLYFQNLIGILRTNHILAPLKLRF